MNLYFNLSLAKSVALTRAHPMSHLCGFDGLKIVLFLSSKLFAQIFLRKQTLKNSNAFTNGVQHNCSFVNFWLRNVFIGTFLKKTHIMKFGELNVELMIRITLKLATFSSKFFSWLKISSFFSCRKITFGLKVTKPRRQICLSYPQWIFFDENVVFYSKQFFLNDSKPVKH